MCVRVCVILLVVIYILCLWVVGGGLWWCDGCCIYVVECVVGVGWC